MISVKDGEELIFYEAQDGQGEKGIWKYFVSNTTWMKIGEMLLPRDDFVVLPVTDITCH